MNTIETKEERILRVLESQPDMMSARAEIERQEVVRQINEMPQRMLESTISKQLAATLSTEVEREVSKMLIRPDRMGAASAIGETSVDALADATGISIRYIRNWEPEVMSRAEFASRWPPAFHPGAIVVTTERRQTPAPPVLPVAHAVAAPAAIDDELLEHERIARKLGVACVAPEIGRARLAEALIAEGITCYDVEEVQRYMAAMAQSKGMSWSWHPARAVDLSSDYEEVYAEAIPLPVLMTMAALVERLGDQVRFQIAAFTQPKLDPFLAVHVAGSTTSAEWFVIERWDEPSFRGIKAA